MTALKAVARYKGQCSKCGEGIDPGMWIQTWGRGWAHVMCHDPRFRRPRTNRPWVQHIRRPQGQTRGVSASSSAPTTVGGDVSESAIASALDAARSLAMLGVPLFVAPPMPIDDPQAERRLFREPSGWQSSKPDPRVVDRWEPGMMLAAVTGVALDVIDTDPRNGGVAGREAIGRLMPAPVAVAATPRGGSHEWIPRLFLRKASGDTAPWPGVDVLAGDREGKGRAYVRLAPTVTLHGEYRWLLPPDPDRVGGDAAPLARAVEECLRERSRDR